MKFLVLSLAAFLLAPTAAQAKLDAAERRMVEVVEAERERSIALLERLVNQNSGTMNFAGVEAVGRMMRAELEPLGFDVKWVPMTQVNRAGHLIATRKGSPRSKRLLLIGHLDTVFEPDSPFQKFALRGDGFAEGPGADDDKGGMVVMLSALRAMHQAGTLKNANIEIVLTGDEEDAGRPRSISRRDLIEAGKRADAALDFEGMSQEGGKDLGAIGRRSSGSWEVRVKARSGHSSGIFGRIAGNGAIYELSRILDAFRTELPEPNLTYNVGMVLGGATATLEEDRIRGSATGKTNIIPETAIALGDIRTLSREQEERARTRMREIVARSLPGASAEISFSDDNYPAMAPSEGNKALFDRLDMVNRDLGLGQMGLVDPMRRGAGDISFVAEHVDGLVGLGASGRGSHAAGEAVDLASITRQAKRVAIFLSRLSRERRR